MVREEDEYEDEEALAGPKRRPPEVIQAGIGKGWIFALIGGIAVAAIVGVTILLIELGVFWPRSRSDAGGWQEVVSAEGRFRVLMPGQPRKEVRTVQSKVGPVTDTNFGFDTSDWSIAVRYADFDDPGQLATPLEDIINAGRDSTVKALKGLVLSETEITVCGHPAKEVMVEVPERGTTYLRSCPVNRRIYTLIFMNKLATSSRTNVNRFFESFQLTE